MHILYEYLENIPLLFPYPDVNQLDASSDLKKLEVFFGMPFQDEDREKYLEIIEKGLFKDFIVEKDGKYVSRAVIWNYSEDRMEIGAVRTLPEFQRRGYSLQLISFCTNYILKLGKKPISITSDDNAPMRTLLEKAGFKIVSEGDID